MGNSPGYEYYIVLICPKHCEEQLQVPNEQYPWCRRHLHMNESCRDCLLCCSLTESLLERGLQVPARAQAIELSFRMMSGSLQKRPFLPTANVDDIKMEMKKVSVARGCAGLLLTVNGFLAPSHPKIYFTFDDF